MSIFILGTVTREGLGPEWGCLRPAGSACVLDFVQEGFHNMSLSDFESTLLKLGSVK